MSPSWLFSNSLNQSEQDSLNSTTNSNFLTKNTQEDLTIIENKSKVQTSENKTPVASASGSSTQDAHITSLTKQVEALLFLHRPALHERPQGALPSNTEPNPREKVNSIKTRSGLTTAEPSIPPPVPPTPRVEVEKELKTLMDEVHITSPGSTAHVPPLRVQPVSPPKPKEDPKPNPHQPKIPYLLRLNKTKLLDKMMFKYLTDSGASINLMPFSIFEKLRIGPLKLTRITLELANRSVTFPMGIAEDVIVKVENFNFLADFVIVDFEADPRVPIILRRPFLRTARALVDLYEEKLTLRVENEEVVFNTDKYSRNNPSDIQFVHCINIIDFSRDKPISGSTTFPSDSSPSPPLVETISSPITDIDIIDPILERFTDEPALVYSALLGDDDDDLFNLKSDNDEWKKLFDSTIPEESSEIATLLSSPFENEDKVFNPGILILGGPQIFNDESKDKDLILEERNFLPISFYQELLFYLELTVIETLLSFSSENEDKVFNPGILTSKGVHSFTLGLSHRTYVTFKIFPFLCFCHKDKGIRGNQARDSQKTSASREAARVFSSFYIS
ncbi:reverse transcriptase domain-containing protein [Tanacetum coccineum]